ncbi:hypothetical protein F4679DRAFT_535164 [Xylaria curta]|nr:hypothetical protein F4679DRAFT_535164 [Xylaria curta]
MFLRHLWLHLLLIVAATCVALYNVYHIKEFSLERNQTVRLGRWREEYRPYPSPQIVWERRCEHRNGYRSRFPIFFSTNDFGLNWRDGHLGEVVNRYNRRTIAYGVSATAHRARQDFRLAVQVPLRIQKSSEQNNSGTAGLNADDVGREDENENDKLSPQQLLLSQPINGAGGESRTRTKLQVPAKSSPNLIGISSQITAQSFATLIHVLTSMIKLYQLLSRRRDNVGTDEVNTTLSLLEAGEFYSLSHVSRGLPQAWPVYQEDAGGYGSTTSPDRGTTSSIAQPDNPTAARISPVLPPRNKRPCYYLLGGLSTGIVSSFALALWWARSQGDLSAGFTLGSYVVGVDALVVAAAGVFHAPSCRCWTTSAKS